MEPAKDSHQTSLLGVDCLRSVIGVNFVLWGSVAKLQVGKPFKPWRVEMGRTTTLRDQNKSSCPSFLTGHWPLGVCLVHLFDPLSIMSFNMLQWWFGYTFLPYVMCWMQVVAVSGKFYSVDHNRLGPFPSSPCEGQRFQAPNVSNT